MKKFLLCIIIAAMSTAAVAYAPANGSAFAAVQLNGGNTVLLAPSSVYADSDCLLICDNVEGGTILHRFYGGSLKSCKIDGETSKIKSLGGTVFLLQKNKITAFDTETETALVFLEQEGLTDFDTDGIFLYFWFKTASGDQLYFKRTDDAAFAPRRIETYNNTQGRKLTAISCLPEGGICSFYVSGGINYTDVFTIGENTNSPGAPVTEPLPSWVAEFTGVAQCMDTLVLYDGSSANALDEKFKLLEFDEIKFSDLIFVNGNEGELGDFYLLTDDRLVLRFSLGFSTETGNYFVAKDETLEIGTAENGSQLPAYDIENYVAAKVKGYPSNIVYTASAADEDTRLDGTLDANDEIMILNYESADEYYYIFNHDASGNGKFGWIKKSDKIETVEKNPLNTTAVVLPFTAFVYPFPCTGDSEAFNSTASAKRKDEIDVLHSFDDKWYFVKSSDGDKITYGFMLQTALGVKKAPSGYTEYTRFSANPKAGKTLSVFSDEALSDPLTDVKGGEIKLKANSEVRVYEKDETKAKICVVIDGVYYRGYVAADGLIPYRGKMTNGQALGLALLIIVLLATALFVVLRIRKKRELKKQDQTEL